jgi:hypothetical protein
MLLKPFYTRQVRLEILAYFDHVYILIRSSKDVFPKMENIELKKQRTLFAKFFGKGNLASVNGYEWKKKRKVGTRGHA